MASGSASRKHQVVTEFRRAEILAAATKVFAGKGFQSTRMEEIARAAGLAKGTLYRYFNSKDAVYEATVQQAISKLATLTDGQVRRQPDFPARLAAFISTRIAFWKEHQQLYRIILSINRQEQHRKRSIAWQTEVVLYLKSIFEQAAAAGEIPQQDFLAVAWTTMDTIRGVNERHAFFDDPPAENEAAFLTAFLLRALGAKTRESR